MCLLSHAALVTFVEELFTTSQLPISTMRSYASLAALLRALSKHYCQALLWTAVVLFMLLNFVSLTIDTNVWQVPSIPVYCSAFAPSPTREPRVALIVVHTGYSPGWCRMQVSSILSRVSVTTIGMGANYTHTSRPSLLLDCITDEGLRDEDVVVVFDGGDTMFTGPLGIKQAVEDFVATTAPTADAFNDTAVHRGEATAPLLFESDPVCYAPQMELMVPWGSPEIFAKCIWYYERVWEAAKSSADQRMVRFLASGYRYLAGGGMVGRVWAFREAYKAYSSLLATSDKWWCDQSIWSLLHVWSVTRDTNVTADFRIRYGLLSLDYNNSFFLTPRSGAFGSPALYHFPGPPYLWDRIPTLLNRTTWVDWLRYSPDVMNETRDFVQNATVKIYDADRKAKTISFPEVCSLNDVLNPEWLALQLSK
ncbi:putative expression site-associated gene (ESAG-like) protein [Trypanosoma cruzi]|uniref:Putative expression site-associated gene (ESAG-like) protein n=1 Tax=Trypanosoma cruzi TaxID=5693 RepID=A0A2V2UZ76_TRYCR|nr:putative expression site-associated gene (ESAG-like) protein [Trypanosoma cruzi]